MKKYAKDTSTSYRNLYQLLTTITNSQGETYIVAEGFWGGRPIVVPAAEWESYADGEEAWKEQVRAGQKRDKRAEEVKAHGVPVVLEKRAYYSGKVQEEIPVTLVKINKTTLVVEDSDGNKTQFDRKHGSKRGEDRFRYTTIRIKAFEALKEQFKDTVSRDLIKEGKKAAKA